MLLLIALLTGAGETQAPPEWYPLAPGSSWEYVVSGTQSFGADTADVSGEMIRSVPGEFQHAAGFPVFMVISDATFTFTPRSGEDPASSSMRDTFYVQPTDSLILRYQSLDDAEILLMMKLPLVVGSSWIFHPSVPTMDEVVSLDETVSVPAGTFQGCAHISEPYTSPDAAGSRNDYYFAAGTGLVKFVLHLCSQDRTDDIVFELRSSH